MRHYFYAPILIAFFLLFSKKGISQDEAVHPGYITTGTFLGVTAPLRDLPPLTEKEWQEINKIAEVRQLNAELDERSYPFASSALPKGPDPAWQSGMGSNRETREPILNYQGQTSPYFPPDANGTAGPNHYVQTINSVYSIYDKSQTLVAGPTAINTLFTGLPGATYNDGDPVVLYDDQAGRWLLAEFSISGANDYMLVGVSITDDPTGSWYIYSFDVDDTPDYPKFGIWQDGYYMATNTSSGSDIYVLERSQMLSGNSAQMVGFDNPWRPASNDGFMCVPPVDNDGPYAPANAPGLFIAFNDDAIGGGTDQLWIYELHVDWTTPINSTFNRVQQINVAAFDSNFGNTWDNIVQAGTTQKLDAIPQVIMNVPQYRNFGTYQTIVCCHTVDVDNTNHAGIRWYELRNTGSTWSVRQQGTFAPDSHSRWMGSIMLNGSNEIGLAYSISSSTLYPGIRYTGQSSSEYASASGIMDIAEETIQTGTNYQSAYNRWGDYSALQVDPHDDETFWFTTEYIGPAGSRFTRIATFQIGPETLGANFQADYRTPEPNTNVLLSDLSSGSVSSWDWSISPSTFTYVNGTSSSSQDPQVTFGDPGFYTVSLIVSDGVDSDTLTKTDYIQVIDCNASLPFSEDFSDEALPQCWSIIDHVGNGQVWSFDNPGGRTINTTTSANGFAILDSDIYGSGNSQDADLVSPRFDFFNYTNITLSFDHYFREYAGSSATLSYSTDNGISWYVIQAWTASTANAATFSQDVTSLVGGKSNVLFKWNYTGTWGYYWAVDDISITGTAQGIWMGTSSTSWGTSANWINNIPPGSSINVTVPASSPNWPIISGDLVLGTDCHSLIMEGPAQLTVSGNLDIPAGTSLIVSDRGTIMVGGGWYNEGLFMPGTGIVVFNGSSPSTVDGLTTATVTLPKYRREAFPGGMTSLTGATSGPSGDNAASDVNIGFPFFFAGTAFSQVRICTNGWLSLDLSGSTATANSDLFTSTAPNTTLAPWWDNLEADGSSSITYKTEGTAPDRVFTVEWKDVLTYNTVATARISFQVKLYETTNRIEFCYGTLTAGTHNNSESASMGIEDATGGSGHFIDGITGSTTTGNSSLDSETDWPSANYRFIPPPVVQEFNNILIDNSGGNIEFSSDTKVHGNFDVTPGSSFGVPNGTILELGNN